ncbi:hypothetical protein Pth03_07890 [Planotetraspora thailandica]|uniref:Uncharacterized protein n=1 Tax=Planotetraspora thailandica TaxID=487172 RepID=A0A8J3XTR6_9ACTN|nr:hypothetical protein [Planotetraspora thailandica]GII52400.1 hypothetical protein Pth03_07890 [Planotetraspora thailandica]
MADYPGRNPFPARGVSSAEETSLPGYLRGWEKHNPTALLPGVRRVVELATNYVEAFTSPVSRDGTLACLRGAHGSGKTHAVRYMMARAADHDDSSSAPVQLYLRLQESDFVAEYRRLVSQVSQPTFTDLSLRYLGALAGDRAAEDVGPGWQGEVMSEVRRDPARVLELFSAHQVEAGEVLEAQARQIAAVAGNGVHFQRALSFLLRPEFSTHAYDWLCGREIEPAAARALGVSSQINDPEMCRYGLQLLATLVTRADRAFMLVLDQCEKFILNDGEPVPANIGLLQGLAEVISRENGMLMLVCSDAGWDCIPVDLRQRLGRNAFQLLPLDPGEARLVVRTYLHPARSLGRDMIGGDSDRGAIWPFTDDAVFELLRGSGGNIRRLLQLCWECFEIASPTREIIDVAVVAQGSAQQRSSLSLRNLALTVEKALLSAGLAIERSQLPGQPLCFLIPDAERPRAVIGLTEAVFFDDEATKAAEVVTLRRRLQDRERPVLTALVITGYASPPVLSLLRGAVHEVLVAEDPSTFLRDLMALVGRLASEPPKESADDRRQLDGTLRQMLAYLESLDSERRTESRALTQSLTQLADQLDRQGSSTATPRGRTSNWPAQRRELTQRIDSVREDRADSNWADFAADAKRLIRERRSTAVGATGVVLALAVIGALFFTRHLGAWSVTLGLAGSGLVAVAAVQAAERFLPLWSRRSRAARSLRDLDQVAKELGPVPRLRGKDPVARYVAAVNADPDGRHDELVFALFREPLVIVRQALADRLALSETPFHETVKIVREGMREGIREVASLAARRQRRAEVESMDGRLFRELPGAIRVILAVANPELRDLWGGSPVRQPAETILAALGFHGTGHPLARAFREGPGPTTVMEMPLNELRSAAHLLSPFNQDGLGTYDRLPVIREIDELYLFFEELIFRREEH